MNNGLDILIKNNKTPANMLKAPICQFCPTTECYKVLNSDYVNCGVLENYGNMLSETFCVNLSKNKNCYICDGCITKLRDANNFKKKVLEAKKRLEDIIEDVKDPNVNFENYLKDNEKIIKQDKTDLPESIISVKIEPTDNEHEMEQLDERSTASERKECLKERAGKSRKKKVKIKPEDQSEHTIIRSHLRSNTIKLLTNSNICVFKSAKTRFACPDCKLKYFEIKELREHSKMHFDVEKIRAKVNRLRGLSYKNADITDLHCNRCTEQCSSLEELQIHLTERHSIMFDGKDHLLIPFRLGNGLSCVVCQQNFHTFTSLLVHMNTHSTNNVCERCGASYFNRTSLRSHIHAMHKTHRCSQCPQLFPTTAMKATHLLKVHNKGFNRRHCLKCGDIFKYTHQLFEHMIEKHGMQRPVYSCPHCAKIFNTRNLLGIHVRNIHVKERNFQCGFCDMRFFTSYDRKRHETKHQSVRSVSCGYCDGLFKSNDYLRKHLKRFHGNQGKSKEVSSK